MQIDKWYHLYGRKDDVVLEEVPKPETERRKGWWITPQNMNKSNGMISTALYYYPKCSVCGGNANFTNFCPNCGADMREEGDE